MDTKKYQLVKLWISHFFQVYFNILGDIGLASLAKLLKIPFWGKKKIFKKKLNLFLIKIQK